MYRFLATLATVVALSLVGTAHADKGIPVGSGPTAPVAQPGAPAAPAPAPEKGIVPGDVPTPGGSDCRTNSVCQGPPLGDGFSPFNRS